MTSHDDIINVLQDATIVTHTHMKINSYDLLDINSIHEHIHSRSYQKDWYYTDSYHTL